MGLIHLLSFESYILESDKATGYAEIKKVMARPDVIEAITLAKRVEDEKPEGPVDQFNWLTTTISNMYLTGDKVSWLDVWCGRCDGAGKVSYGIGDRTCFRCGGEQFAKTAFSKAWYKRLEKGLGLLLADLKSGAFEDRVASVKKQRDEDRERYDVERQREEEEANQEQRRRAADAQKKAHEALQGVQEVAIEDTPNGYVWQSTEAIERGTEKAVLVKFYAGTMWVPKSVMIFCDRSDEFTTDIMIGVKTWFARKEGLSSY